MPAITQETATRESVPREDGAAFRVRYKKTHAGVDLWLWGPAYEEFFKSITPEGADWLVSSTPGWREHKGYRGQLQEKLFDLWGQPLFTDAGAPNLSFFRAKGLSEGVKFALPGVYSTGRLDAYVAYLIDVSKNMYKHFLHPAEKEITVYVREAISEAR